MFPVLTAFNLSSQAESQRFLVQDLWAYQAVGIIGGEPKCCKSFMALTLAVAVASGKPCLGRFNVSEPGSVLFYPAEDALTTVRSRIQGICASQNIDFASLPLLVITASSLQLDQQSDLSKLIKTIEEYKPRLLILDPFVRLHAIDENASGEVAKLLQQLRALQRNYKMAVALVHHSKKGAASKRPGQALRGSSDFHAWGDSNLFLTRNSSDLLSLTVEHRAAQPPAPLALSLLVHNNLAHLEIIQSSPFKLPTPSSQPTPTQQIISLLAAANEPMRSSAIRQKIGLRNETVCASISALLAQGVIALTPKGYSFINSTPTSS